MKLYPNAVNHTIFLDFTKILSLLSGTSHQNTTGCAMIGNLHNDNLFSMQKSQKTEKPYVQHRVLGIFPLTNPDA